jgi:hypothetical protein
MPEPRVMLCAQCFAQGKIGNLDELEGSVEAPTAGQLIEITEAMERIKAQNEQEEQRP